MDLLLHADDIHASYDQRRILKGIDLTIQRGEILGLIGTNGAGKSTLMSVLSGSHRHDAGQITLVGEKYAPESLDEARACGVDLIAQNFRLDPELTVAETIFRSTFQAGKSTAELHDQASALIQKAGVELDPDAKVADLIRAEQVLTEVLRMLASEAQLVIMDEVASALADHDIAIVHRVIRMLTEQGRSVIYITHRLDEIRSIAGRIAVLRDGTVHRILDAGETDADELTFLLLQQELEKTPRPTDLVNGTEVLRVSDLSVGEFASDVNFEISSGEIFGLAGTYRSGVYQLIEALIGTRPATSGQVFVHGVPVRINDAEDAVQLKIGYLSDAVEAADPETSIAGSLQPSTEADPGLEAEVTQLRDVIDLVRRMHINTTNIHGTVATLSGGDQQKVELAKWMTTDCDVLILSHPSRGIDIGAKEVVYKMLAELAQTGVAIILLSSDMSELVSWCHRIGVMKDGELVSVGASTATNEDRLMRDMLGKEFVTMNTQARRAAPAS